ncbi:MAG: diphosphomevalonate decarboxylase [Candidatus Micrarchaeota archaeon]
MRTSTFVVTPNVAVVKYWGKRDNQLNLPDNGSISVTMDETVRTITSVEFNPNLVRDSLILNGKPAKENELVRAVKVLDAIRKKAGIKNKACVISENNFPTAAGLASSASGFAALACAGAEAAGLEATERELSIFARLGSGSACRSVLGGFVEWKKGSRKDGLDSYAVQLASSSHWPELRNIITIVDPGRKRIGSAEGMEITTRTSKLYMKRVKENPKLLSAMRRAIRRRDLENFLMLTMCESSRMHAVMMDSFPPIIYLNDVSREIIESVLGFNTSKGMSCAGYTFDAGPNAHVYTISKYEKEVRTLLSEINGVEKIIISKPGEGPRRLPDDKSLI